VPIVFEEVPEQPTPTTPQENPVESVTVTEIVDEVDVPEIEEMLEIPAEADESELISQWMDAPKEIAEPVPVEVPDEVLVEMENEEGVLIPDVAEEVEGEEELDWNDWDVEDIFNVEEEPLPEEVTETESERVENFADVIDETEFFKASYFDDIAKDATAVVILESLAAKSSAESDSTADAAFNAILNTTTRSFNSRSESVDIHAGSAHDQLVYYNLELMGSAFTDAELDLVASQTRACRRGFVFKTHLASEELEAGLSAKFNSILVTCASRRDVKVLFYTSTIELKPKTDETAATIELPALYRWLQQSYLSTASKL
jgi:hypothetical protein